MTEPTPKLNRRQRRAWGDLAIDPKTAAVIVNNERHIAETAAQPPDQVHPFARKHLHNLKQMLGLLPEPESPEPNVAIVDGRAVIRREKPEATTGPPPDTPKNELPRHGANQAGRSSEVSGQTTSPDATRHRREIHSEISERDFCVLGLVDAEDPRDLIFARKVIDLWALGPRPLAQFLIHLAASSMQRTELERLVDRYLGGKSP